MNRLFHGGWKPDFRDFRDHFFNLKEFLERVPTSSDHRHLEAPCYDQKTIGSCTGNAISGEIQFERRKLGLADFIPSRLQIYYDEREMEGTVGMDAGAQIRDGIKCVNKFGAAPESLWPYDVSKFTVKPPKEVYDAAKLDRALKYGRVKQDIDFMRQMLSQEDGFVFGFKVYPSFMSDTVAKTGMMSMPTMMDRIRGPIGGHAVKVSGHDDNKERFIIRNSWGPEWGDGGYFYMPYDYLLNPLLTSDLWNIELIG